MDVLFHPRGNVAWTAKGYGGPWLYKNIRLPPSSGKFVAWEAFSRLGVLLGFLPISLIDFIYERGERFWTKVALLPLFDKSPLLSFETPTLQVCILGDTFACNIIEEPRSIRF
jgi:hypothetical protein